MGREKVRARKRKRKGKQKTKEITKQQKLVMIVKIKGLIISKNI